jgi:anthranilate synthase component 2
MPKILLLDNFDSFTYNLHHYLEEINEGGVEVVRNTEAEKADLEKYTHIVLSPGPGLPSESEGLLQLIKDVKASQKLLGICLGQQAIAEVFSMKLRNLAQVVQGKATTLQVLDPEDILFKGLPRSFKVGRYHSWVVDKTNFHRDFRITSEDENGEIMSISHKTFPISAVQFHPESILTEYGKEMLKNWLN